MKAGALTGALIALMSTGAMAQVVTAGQYATTTQYTALVDPQGLCTGAGITVGLVTTGTATVGGLGLGVTQTINTPAQTSPYGVGYIQCTYGALPAKTDFTKNSNGSYTATPAAPTTTTCTASSGITYTLTSANNPSGNPPMSNTITLLPKLGTLSTFKETAGFSAVAVGGQTICLLSTDSTFSRSGK